MPRLWQILGQRQVHLPDLGLDLQQMQSQQHPTKWLILSPGQFWWSHHRREKTPLLHEGEGEEKEGDEVERKLMLMAPWIYIFPHLPGEGC